MELQIRARNTEVSESVRKYAEEKLQRLERHLNDSPSVELELLVERNPSISASQVAEATVRTRGLVVRARESSPDMRASIDQLTDKLTRQVKRYRNKRRVRGQRVEGMEPELPDFDRDETDTDDSDLIVKVKQFPVKPMSPEEAVLQLELVGHDFFVFQSAESGDANVVYRRKDGRYGLIEPQL
jgi:ribosome hibernation promoting factor